MDSLLPSRLLRKLSSLSTTSTQQLISYLGLLHARNYSRATLDAVTVAIKRFLLNLPEARRAAVAENLAHTIASDIDSFIESARSKELSPTTINITLSSLKEFFDFLREAAQMQLQPTIRRRHRLFVPSTLPKPMPEADLIQLFKVIDSVRDRLIFLLMLRCGLRVSEVCHLTWHDVDFRVGTIRINNSKGLVDRVVYIAPDLEKSLRLWQARNSSSDYLFPSRKVKSAPLTRGDLGWLMNKYLRLADIKLHYSPHCLRHSFATQLLNAGVSLEVLKELMGHRSIQMTLRYTKLYESTKRQQYEQAMVRIEKRQSALGGEL
ncbi:MAG: tyrosine-type recombinase/integrase [Blastocatellia bacterium]